MKGEVQTLQTDFIEVWKQSQQFTQSTEMTYHYHKLATTGSNSWIVCQIMY